MATSEAIRRKILGNVYRIENIHEVLANRGKKWNSNVWNFMSAIYTDENTLIETHISCRLCKCVLKYSLTSGNKSTSNLLKHLKNCSPIQNQNVAKSKLPIVIIDSCLPYFLFVIHFHKIITFYRKYQRELRIRLSVSSICSTSEIDD